MFGSSSHCHKLNLSHLYLHLFFVTPSARYDLEVSDLDGDTHDKTETPRKLVTLTNFKVQSQYIDCKFIGKLVDQI